MSLWFTWKGSNGGIIVFQTIFTCFCVNNIHFYAVLMIQLKKKSYFISLRGLNWKHILKLYIVGQYIQWFVFSLEWLCWFSLSLVSVINLTECVKVLMYLLTCSSYLWVNKENYQFITYLEKGIKEDQIPKFRINFYIASNFDLIWFEYWDLAELCWQISVISCGF